MDVGPSRELFELWAPDSRNGVIITGYSIEGTLARVSFQDTYDAALCMYLLVVNGRIHLSEHKGTQMVDV